MIAGAPEEIRTPDPQIRSLTLTVGKRGRVKEQKKGCRRDDFVSIAPNERGAYLKLINPPLECRERTGVRFERERV